MHSSIKDLAGTIVAVAAAAGVSGSVVYSTGWVVSESRAQEIAQQTVAQESISRERGYLELQRELKFSRLRVLNAQPMRTADEDLELSILRDDIKRITERLEELK